MGLFFEKLRVVKRKYYIWKYRLKHVHSTFIASPRCHISLDFEAGEFSFVGPGCTIYPKVKIGRYTMLANDVKILGGDHYYKRVCAPIIFSGREELRPTVIGNDVWVGAYSLVMAGVTIGNGAIVAAGSVVTKDVPPYAVVGGCPAKFIKMRFDKEQIAEHEKIINQPSSVLPSAMKHILTGKS
jgi:acetyltransferase-like isoleucine patch superfamily enzyme